MEEKKYMVCVQCITYNHAVYIEDAMKGFAMQETQFPFVCVIMDDASTDDNRMVIDRFISENFDLSLGQEETDDYILNVFQHKSNKNCFFATQYLKYNHYSKKKKKYEYIIRWLNSSSYFAICEGDDYWTDPLKLQKQVDYFKSHPQCGLVYTAYRQQNDVTGQSYNVFTSPNIKHDETFKWKLLEQKVKVGTCTALIESELKNQILEIKDDFQGFMMGDTQTWFNAARAKEVGYIPEVTGVYRKQVTGATATFNPQRRIDFIMNAWEMHSYLANKYGAPADTKMVIKLLYGSTCFNLYYMVGDYNSAVKLNQDYFHNSWIMKFINTTARNLGLKKVRGLVFFLRTCAKLGLLKMD